MTASNPVWSKHSCGLAVVILEQSTESLSAFHSLLTIMGRWATGKRKHIAQSLMGSFLTVVLHVLAQHMTQ